MIPTASERDAMLQTGLYRGMENFSDAWLKRHAARVADYSREWCADPFHAWSRGWEYPWAVKQLCRARLHNGGTLRLLDAGSGATFFPFFLREFYTARVTCVDSAPAVIAALGDVEQALEAIRPRRPSLELADADIGALPHADGTFDAIVCISVLEHCPAPLAVLAELQRVTHSGGLVICTWDIPAREGALSFSGLSVFGTVLEVQ